LIYGIPGLTGSQWRDTLRKAVELRTTHISAYSLSLDEGSMLYQEVLSGAVTLPDDELIARQYEDAVEILGEAGYQQYEISNFCMPSYECRHNMNYWDRGEYIGIGPGAWSFSGNRRTRNIADSGAYISRLEQNEAPVDFEEVLDSSQAATEELLLGLRRTSGMDLAAYAERRGAAVQADILARVDALSGTGLFFFEKGILRLSRKGMLLSNEALSRIIL
jgi:oxygen-independent coproporphyrinogen-3 oxidase